MMYLFIMENMDNYAYLCALDAIHHYRADSRF